MPARNSSSDRAQMAYRFALDPTPRQARMMSSHAGAARFAYNWGVAAIIAALDAREAQKTAGTGPDVKVPGHFDLCKAWVVWKNEHAADPDPPEGERRTNTAWVGENSASTYQAALRDAAKAWSDFFASKTGKRAGRRLGRPRFKKKGRCPDSFQVHGSLRMAGGKHVVLPKIGTVTVMSDDSLHPAMRRSRSRARPGQARHMGNRRRARLLCRLLARDATARLVRATVTRGADGLWWCSVTCEMAAVARQVPSRVQRAGGLVGVDFGVREVCTVATPGGDVVRVPNHAHLLAALAELRVASRALSRCQPGSGRWEKAKARLGVIHADVARLRADSLHRATTVLARQHDVIAVEGWDVQETIRYRTRGKVRRPAPGGPAAVPEKVRRPRNRALADTGIGMARQMLGYKGARLGVRVLVADKNAKTGRTCAVHGTARTTPLPPYRELFTSDKCTCVRDRRVNTAMALARWARGAPPLPLVPVQSGPDRGPVKPRGGNRSAARPGLGVQRVPVMRAASARSRGEAGIPAG